MFGIQECNNPSVIENQNSRDRDTEEVCAVNVPNYIEVMQQVAPHKEASHIGALRDYATESSTVIKQRNRNQQRETLSLATCIFDFSPHIGQKISYGKEDCMNTKIQSIHQPHMERNTRDQNNYVATTPRYKPEIVKPYAEEKTMESPCNKRSVSPRISRSMNTSMPHVGITGWAKKNRTIFER